MLLGRLGRASSTFHGPDPWDLSPRQVVAYAVLDELEDRRNDVRTYEAFRLAIGTAFAGDQDKAKKADQVARKALNGTQ